MNEPKSGNVIKTLVGTWVNAVEIVALAQTVCTNMFYFIYCMLIRFGNLVLTVKMGPEADLSF